MGNFFLASQFALLFEKMKFYQWVERNRQFRSFFYIQNYCLCSISLGVEINPVIFAKF